MNSSMTRSLNRSGTASSKLTHHISSFCSAENFAQTLAFLDQELSVYGYPSVQNGGPLNKVMLVNVTYDLLKNYRKSLEAHSNTVDDLRTYESEAARAQHLLSLAKEDIANKDRELKSKCIEEAHLQQRIESLRKKFKLEQDKCRKMSADLASRDTQYKHEKKKKVQEIEKLQAKLHQLLQDKRHERLLGIELLNSLQRTDGKRGKWNTDKNKKNNEQDMYRLIITNYEDSQRQLLSENADMRKYLKQMQDELIAALNEKVTKTESRRSSLGSPARDGSRRESLESVKTSNSEDSELSLPMSEGVFEMPYNLVKEDIERSLKSKWKALRKMHKQRFKSDDNLKKSSSNRELKDLPQKLEEYEKIVKEQQDLIDFFTSCQDGKKSSLPKDAYFLEEKAELEKTKSRFYHQRLAFEKERKIYTEALIQIGQDRQDFEEEKAKWLQSKFLQLTPFRESPSPPRTTKTNGNTEKATKYRKKLSSSWNEGSKTTAPDTSLRSSRGEADGMGQSGASPGNSPALSAKSPNLRQYYASPDHINPWTKDSPPVPSTCELYRALGLRYSDKENRESTSRSCFDLTKDLGSNLPECIFNPPGCNSINHGYSPTLPECKPFSRSASLDSLHSYYTPILGRTPEDGESPRG